MNDIKFVVNDDDNLKSTAILNAWQSSFEKATRMAAANDGIK